MIPKILLLTENWNQPSELFIRQHIRMLQETDMLSAIALMRHTGRLEWEGYPILGLDYSRWWWPNVLDKFRSIIGVSQPYFPDNLKAKQVLQSIDYDIIFCEYATVAVKYWDFLQQSQKPIVVHVHGFDILPELHSSQYFDRFQELSQLVTIIANSQWTIQQLIDLGIPEANIVLKYIGVSVADTFPRIQGELPEKWTILHLGRLVDFKAPDLTIKAFELACERGLNAELIVAGDGELRAVCEALKADSKWGDQIHLLGAVSAEEGQALRAKADIFTQHSILGYATGRTENYGVSIVEAMAAGIPVVSCKMGGIQETVIDDETGILVPSGDIEAQAQAFLNLAANPELYWRMAHNGWQRAKENFSYQAEKQTLTHIFEQITLQ